MPSEWRAYTAPGASGRSSKQHVHLTALAQQACDQEGVDPHDLMYREIWQFAEPNISEEIQLMRHSAYMQLREDKMDCVLKARDAIITARSEREALSKAVEAKIRGTVAGAGEEDGGEGVSGKDGGSVRSPVSRGAGAGAPRAPVTFPSQAGFSALYSQAPEAGHGDVKASSKVCNTVCPQQRVLG